MAAYEGILASGAGITAYVRRLLSVPAVAIIVGAIFVPLDV